MMLPQGRPAQSFNRSFSSVAPPLRDRVAAGPPVFGKPEPAPEPDGSERLQQVAHDLRSPLNAILLLAEELTRELRGRIDPIQGRRLQLIYGTALYLCSMADDLVQLPRESGLLVEQDPASFSPSVILESVREVVLPLAEERDLTVDLYSQAPTVLRGHPVAVCRVLLNLVLNALKFTMDGAVTLGAIEVTGDRDVFSVHDTGKGIGSDALRTLYQPFRAAPGGAGWVFSSTGLGLTICRQLLRAMGSELQLETQPGRGTRFSFALSLPSVHERDRRCHDPSV
ncbi:MAG TPA: HAMP domain-containing sensor histidine kinase [Gemmatimonadales bacterium]|nr:HAMP domain-containing sensor histidine kinase [Gemmatimonadales bacterium]